MMPARPTSSRSARSSVRSAIADRRLRWTVALVVLAGLASGSKFAWDRFASSIRTEERYQVTADGIEITPPPEWVRRDVKRDALQDAGLDGALSILDDHAQLLERMNQAFRFHPWVRSVERIELRPPATIHVALTYRRPIAAIEVGSPEQPQLFVVDSDLIRLPEMDLIEAEKRHLPRILRISNRPLVGEVWSDPRVAGGVRLITAFGDAWTKLHLVDVMPSEFPEVRGAIRFFVYDVVSSGGTRIVWGAAPGDEPPGEAPFAEKLKVLKSFVAQNGPLSSIYTPQTIDLRKELTVEQRTVKQLDATGDESEIRK